MNDESTEVLQVIGPTHIRQTLDDASPALRFGAAVAEFAEILRESEHSEGADFESVIALANDAMNERDASQVEFVELVERAAELWAHRAR